LSFKGSMLLSQLLIEGDSSLMHLTLLAAAAPLSVEWSPKVGLIMILCNVVAIAIAKLTVKQPNVGLGLPMPAMFGGMSHGAMLGATSFGHVLGAGVILGLATTGSL